MIYIYLQISTSVNPIHVRMVARVKRVSQSLCAHVRLDTLVTCANVSTKTSKNSQISFYLVSTRQLESVYLRYTGDINTIQFNPFQEESSETYLK